MLINWRFDIVDIEHWLYAWDLWNNGIWIIDDRKEWAFVLIIFSFIPLWLTGWAVLSLIHWEEIVGKLIAFPMQLFKGLFKQPANIIKTKVTVKTVQKRKSYKEIRPRAANSLPVSDSPFKPLPSSLLKGQSRPKSKHSSSNEQTFAPIPASIPSQPPYQAPSPYASEQAPKPVEAKEFDHSLFKFDDDSENDFDFNFDSFDIEEKKEEPKEKAPEASEKPYNKKDNDRNNNNNKNKQQKDNRKNKQSQPPQSQKPQKHGSSNSTLDVLKQKGYEVISTATIKNHSIDFIAISNSQICICLNDKDAGDWLADEERFNDEEPLWFSENSHRISPVRKIDIARRAIKEKLETNNLSFDIKAFVIIQIGNIINAEDMFEVWNDMDISVTRIDRGTPKELKLFSREIEDAGEKIDSKKFEDLKKLLRSIP